LLHTHTVALCLSSGMSLVSLLTLNHLGLDIDAQTLG